MAARHQKEVEPGEVLPFIAVAVLAVAIISQPGAARSVLLRAENLFLTVMRYFLSVV